MKKIKVILYQKPLGIEISEKDISVMKQFGPHFICFPEYFFVDQTLGNRNQTPENQQKQINRIKNLSIKLSTVVIGGTMPELYNNKLYNTSFIYNRGEELGFYRKKNLFQPEVGTITPGDQYKTFTAYGIIFGVLICADVFHDESFEYMKNNNTKIVFSPTFSLIKQETVEEKFKRDRDIYVRGASISNAVIVKVCGVKSEYKTFLQARSLIANQDEILYRVQPDEEDKSLIIMEDIFI